MYIALRALWGTKKKDPSQSQKSKTQSGSLRGQGTNGLWELRAEGSPAVLLRFSDSYSLKKTRTGGYLTKTNAHPTLVCSLDWASNPTLPSAASSQVANCQDRTKACLVWWQTTTEECADCVAYYHPAASRCVVLF
jgi:hypothetical protein